MKKGDFVLTKNDEKGLVVRKWEHNDDSYDWWIEIKFTSNGIGFVSREPHKEEDLRIFEKNVDKS